MSLHVVKEGLLTTVQDLGRYDYRSFGVNPSGAMDRTAARLLNLLLDNDENAAVLEMHFPAGEFFFEEDIDFAIGGADFSAELSNGKVTHWAVTHAQQQDVLRFVKKQMGSRAYLAVSGGFQVDEWLGSSSTSLVTATGGFCGRRLVKDDRIPIKPAAAGSPNSSRIGNSLVPSYSDSPSLRVTRGPEFDMLTGVSQHQLFTEAFAISPPSDRMGFRLNGPRLFRLSDAEILSSGTTFGTIQLLPDGQMIVLMADHQTTGGYPRIATIASVDLPLIAQLGPGNKLSFDLVEAEHAERLVVDLEKSIALLRIGLRVSNGRL
jgi:antagonist of KipI